MRKSTSLYFSTGSGGGRKAKMPSPKTGNTSKIPKKAARNFLSKKDINFLIDKAKTAALSKEGRMMFKNTVKILQSNGSKTFKLGAYLLSTILAPSSDDERQHSKLVHNGGASDLVLGTDTVKVHKRTVTTGVPTSKTLLDLVKENGKTSLELFESKTNTATADTGYYFTRQQLTFGTGFEQRGYTGFGRPSYVTYRDIMSYVGQFPEDIRNSISSLQRVYASVLNSRVEYMIRNQSAYLKAKVKVHLCTFNTPGNSPAAEPLVALAGRVFYLNMTLPPDFEEAQEKVPIMTQYGQVTLETSGGATPNYSLNVDMINQGSGIMTSPYFRQNFSIVDTQSVTLGAGDFLKYKHIHEFGGGVDLTAAASAFSPSETGTDYDNHLNYFALIEYVGLPCEIQYIDEVEEDAVTYIGTSPVVLKAEIRKGFSYVNADGGQLLDGGGSEIRDRPPMHTRMFSLASYARAIDGVRNFNLPLSQFSDQLLPGKYSVAVMTDRFTSREVSPIVTEATEIEDEGL